MKPEITDAISALHPTNSFVLRGDNYSQIEWVNAPESPSTQKQVDDKLTELIAEYDAQEYARKRKEEYPPLAEQLDLLWHAIDTDTLDDKDHRNKFYSRLKQVKDDNPKG
jgi:hypothetical protein